MSSTPTIDLNECQTLTVPQAARVLGKSPRAAQQQIATTGTLYGIPILNPTGTRSARMVSRVLLERYLKGELPDNTKKAAS